MKKKRSGKLNIFLCVAAALFCATLFSAHFTGGLYARYTTKSTGSDSARVAAFRITQEGTIFEEIEANVTPGTTESVTLTIKNNSEVVVDYTLTVTNVTGNIAPLKFKLQAKDSNTQSVTAETHENGISVNKVRRAPGNHTDVYTLLIVWEKSDNEETDLAYVGLVDYITVSVTATQVD